MSGTILFIAPSAYPLGGVQVWLDYMLEGLQSRGWRTTLGLVSGKHHDVDQYLEVHPCHNVVRIYSPTGSRQGRISAISRQVEQLDPDLVIVINIVDSYQAINMLKVSKGFRGKVIATLHGIEHSYLQDFAEYADTIDAVVCTNQLSRQLVIRHSGIDSTRVHYAPYGVVTDPAPLQPRVMADGGMTIAYVGRFEETQKRIGDLVSILQRVLDEIPGVSILVAGDGPDRPALERWINDNTSGQVDYKGILGADDLEREVYGRADVLLLTSCWETGPIVAWEAMARGVLLVSSRYTGLQQEGSLVDRENCLLFEVGDVGAATQCLHQARDPATRGRIAGNGRKLVEARYSRETSIGAWHACLQQVCSQDSILPEKIVNLPVEPGRLSKWFGNQVGEQVRTLLGSKFVHNGPGGEWPHSNHGSVLSHSELLDALT